MGQIGSSPRPPAALTAAARAGPAMPPPIGAEMIGNSIPSRSVSLVRDGMKASS
jgi:hypothetical protein